MDAQTIHWWPWVWGSFKMLKGFGLLPGVLAAVGVRKFYQKWQQRRALEGWPAIEGTVQSGEVQQEGTRSYWAEVTYTYYVGEYRVGRYVKHFRKEADAADFVRQLKDKRVQVRYDERKPDSSVLLERDLEMIVLMRPELS